MCCDADSAPPPDPKIAENLLKQTELAGRLVDMTEENNTSNQARLVKLDALNEKSTNLSMDLAAKAEKRADDSYNFYQTEGRPLIKQAFDDAKNYDSADSISAARGRASSDVLQAASDAEGASSRALSRIGVNPNSGRFAELQRSLQAQKTAQVAGAETNAEEGRRAGAIQMRQQASNLANGLPAQSLAQGNQSLNGVAQGSAITTGGFNTNLSSQGARTNGIGSAAGVYGSVAGGYNNLYGSQLQATQINNNASGSEAAGWGNLLGTAVGFLADGGKVSGAGTGTSDDVPAVNKDNGQRIQLSNGEYVLSADTVRAIGTDKLDKLQAKYHTPVNLGRKAA